MGVLTSSDWRLEHELPASVLIFASRVGGGDYIKGLRLLAGDASTWVGRVARWLLEDPEVLARALREADAGLRPSEETLWEVLEAAPARG